MSSGSRLTVLVLSLAVAAPARGAETDEARLTALSAAVRAADYHGDRTALQALAARLGGEGGPTLTAPRAYWRGFAYWRRAINGFNESPQPGDLRQDLEAAVTSFRAALEARPGWIEPQIGMVGCMGSLLYLGGKADPRFGEIVAELRVLLPEIERGGAANPRALWIIGGYELAAPPPRGGQPEKAATTMRRGLDAARAEALAPEPRGQHDPTWGAAENLMNLAYLYSHSSLVNRELALAYAEGALAVVPDWHYVRDILLPQVEALPAPGAAPGR